jgi:hypothetical protein
MEEIFRTSKKPSYKAAWAKILKNEHIALAEYYQDAVALVSDYKYGYIGSHANMLATIADDSFVEGPCRFALMRKPLEKVNYAFGFRKGTNYAALFDKW